VRKRAKVYLVETQRKKDAVIFCPHINKCYGEVFRKCGVRKKYKKMGYRIVCLNPQFYSESLFKNKGAKFLEEIFGDEA